MARRYTASAVISGKLYVVGGQGTAALEMYDPATNRWTARAGMSTARQAPGAATIGGVLYVVGGFDGGNYLASAEAYDPATKTWGPVEPAFTTRANRARPRSGRCSTPSADSAVSRWGMWP